jgi:uncharacterized membrane protein YgaE (UPF0421/DUF939 family)
MLKIYASKYKTLAKAIVAARKNKANIKKSTEAKTITDTEKIACIIIGLFGTFIGALIMWWIMIKCHDSDVAKINTIINIEFPDAYNTYKTTKDKQTKEDMKKLMTKLSTKAHKIVNSLENINDRKEEVKKIKANKNWKLINETQLD